MKQTHTDTTKHSDHAPFADLIRSRMNELGINKLEEFADRINIGRTTIYDLTSGRKNHKGQWVNPSLEVLFKLEAALNTPIAELVECVRPKQPNQQLIDYSVFVGEFPMTQTGVNFQRELRDEE